jgi:flagellar protein FliJ
MAGKFKLQSVLNYRQSLEDQAQQVLTASLQSHKSLESKFQQQVDSFNDYDRELKLRQQEGLTVAEMDLYESQIHHCRRMMVDLQQKLDQLNRQINEDRNALQQAARDRQIMEKLKDKQDEEYRQELSRQERIMLDEISLRSKGNKS